MKNLNKKWGIPVFAWQREAESLDICSLSLLDVYTKP